MRFIIPFFLHDTRNKRSRKLDRFQRFLPLFHRIYIVFEKKVETRYIGDFFFFFTITQHSIYKFFTIRTRARRRERRYRDSVPSFEEDCSRLFSSRGRGKNEKVSNLIRARITSPDASRGFPSGATLCLYTIIGVWDPGVPLSVFSAPLDSGTPHCNLSELQFAQLRSPSSSWILPRILPQKDHNIYFRDYFHRSVIALFIRRLIDPGFFSFYSISTRNSIEKSLLRSTSRF